MLTLTANLNDWADSWLRVMGAVLWQSLLLAVVAALVAWCLRRSSPVVRYWLWQIVAIKLLLMPVWTLAVQLPSWPLRSPPGPSVEFQPPQDPAIGPSESPLPDHSPPPQRADPVAARQRFSLSSLLATISWQAWLLVAWLAVVLFQFLLVVAQRLRLARLLKRATPPDQELAKLLVELAGQMRVRHTAMALSVAGNCPLFVCGLWRPKIVLPIALMSSLGTAQQRQVLLHELAHVKRHDLLWGWTAEFARIVYFFHPLAWWVSHQLRLERELACDQLAMAYSGHPPSDYAQTLVHVVSHTSQPPGMQTAAISAGIAGNQLRPEPSAESKCF
jgi:Zn-dependent protease with chaperone function